MNLATSYFLILILMNYHRGLNTPNVYNLELQQVFVSRNSADDASEDCCLVVVHKENFSTLP